MGLFSKTCEHGVRAMIYLARQPPDTSHAVKIIAKELGAPFHFLSKILQSLGEAGLVKTARGVGGGVALARPAREISLYDIVVAIEGDARFTACMLGLPGCGEQSPCALHAEWAVRRRELEMMLKRATLARLAQRGARY